MAKRNMLKIGTLGAARITAAALISPARSSSDVTVSCVAAREPERAAHFAAKHNIGTVYRSYADVLADAEVNAVYIPLPNSLHHRWTVRALDAGKHVLCEKPLASNVEQASDMVRAAQLNGRILMEAFHYRYHPMAERMHEIVNSGVLGAIRHIEVDFCTTLRKRNDIRLRYGLAGGALMDLGCYALHIARFLAGAEPAITSVRAETGPPAVDTRLVAELLFPPGVTARIECSFFTRTLFKIQAVVTGEEGELRVTNPILPHYFNLIRLRTQSRRYWEHVPGQSTYAYQLKAFAEAVRTGEMPVTGGTDAVANMRLIDALYGAAGLPRRGM